MSDFISKMSKDMGLPYDDVEKCFQELQCKGMIYTPAKTAKEFSSGKYPIRAAFAPPSNSSKPDSVTFGPFCVKPDEYVGLKNLIQDQDIFNAMLALLRLSYETTGGAVHRYQFSAKEDDLVDFIRLIDFWDTNNPKIFEHVVWIAPKEECRKIINSKLKKRFKSNSYKWWDVRINLGKSLKPTNSEDYPDDFVFMPIKIFDSWVRYLPNTVFSVLSVLCSKAFKGGKIRYFAGLNEILPIIDEILEHDAIQEIKTESSVTDRELLLKELCDYNSLPYPVDSNTVFDFLCKLGFIQVNNSELGLTYSLKPEIPDPLETLKFRDGWQERFEKYLITGTVLFSYLSYKEALSD